MAGVQSFAEVLNAYDLKSAGNPSWVYLRAKSRRRRSGTRLRAQPHTLFLPVESVLRQAMASYTARLISPQIL